MRRVVPKSFPNWSKPTAFIASCPTVLGGWRRSPGLKRTARRPRFSTALPAWPRARPERISPGLAEIKHVLGDDMNEVTSALVARMGRDNKGNFSPNNFLRDYEQITPGAKIGAVHAGASARLG